MKKYAVLFSILLLLLYFLLKGALSYNGNGPAESMAGLLPLLLSVGLLLLGMLGGAYFALGKRHEKSSSRLERALLTLCIIITVVVPLLTVTDFGWREALITHYHDRYSVAQIKSSIGQVLKNTFLVGQGIFLILFAISLRSEKKLKKHDLG